MSSNIAYTSFAIETLDEIVDRFRAEVERVAEFDLQKSGGVVGFSEVIDAAECVLASGTPWLDDL